IAVRPGERVDTFLVKIRANYDSSALGFSGVSGNRHPIVFLPVRVESVYVETTDAHQVVITDNFVLLYVWYQGQRRFLRGEERFVRFTAKPIPVALAERRDEGKVFWITSGKFLFGEEPKLSFLLAKDGVYHLAVYNQEGRLLWQKREKKRRGLYSLSLPEGLKSGVYFLIGRFGKEVIREKFLRLR
ncbi:MAG: T9SS type A sorting domain-containing protein, partial [candidate division WOR-3 bacterium]